MDQILLPSLSCENMLQFSLWLVKHLNHNNCISSSTTSRINMGILFGSKSHAK